LTSTERIRADTIPNIDARRRVLHELVLFRVPHPVAARR
jgi:hypothetical protein